MDQIYNILKLRSDKELFEDTLLGHHLLVLKQVVLLINFGTKYVCLHEIHVDLTVFALQDILLTINVLMLKLSRFEGSSDLGS